ncbi:MAG: YvcK family protein [Candidatus Firestonebacteria bacterium]|nr:YvcK family protein [Candidatus Firestonebacteria bacterium]
MQRLKWFYPGMKIKRWLLLSLIGNIFIFFGLSERITYDKTYLMFQYPSFFFNSFDLILIIAGSILVIIGIQKSLRSILNVLIPEKEDEIVNLVFKKRQLEKGPKIVAIGGGTGLPILLQGIKEITSNITAIVTVADDGGSSGRLRKDFQVLPPGDIRNCLVSLADQEFLMGSLFQYRFPETSQSSLAGHNFGNLFITAMTQVTGDFDEAIRQSSKVLAIRGQVIPATLENIVLVAEFDNGSFIEGESKISKTSNKIKKVFIRPEECKPNPECIKAIEEADIIILAPGSLYTSLLPNLIIKEITSVILKSSALKLYICNIMTQPGETDGYTASEHVRVILDHTDKGIFKYIMVNKVPISENVLKRYKESRADIVTTDAEKLRSMGMKVIEEDLLYSGDMVRHDPKKLAKAILTLLIDTNIRQRDLYIKRRWGLDLLEGKKPSITKLFNKNYKVFNTDQKQQKYDNRKRFYT